MSADDKNAGDTIKREKAAIRKKLRKARRDHAANLPKEVAALVFRRPPTPVVNLIPKGATIGLYRSDFGEAPAAAYAKFFLEAGHTIALPRIKDLKSPMQFHIHTDPFDESDLEEGIMGLMQPSPDAQSIVPDVLFMPLVGFTARGERIGQGGGFYDRWLEANPMAMTFGMAWDVQCVDTLPLEDHDIPIGAIITPTRLYGPF